MLSNTGGFRSRNVAKTMERHRSVATVATTLCHHLTKGGKCPLYTFEQTLRRELVNAKEKELKKQAIELLKLEHEMAQDETTAATVSLVDFSPSQENIAKVIAAVKQEKAYQDWSLDRDVAKRLLELKRYSCPYSHLVQTEVAPTSTSNVTTEGQSPIVSIVECAKVFRQFSVFQKLITLAMLAGSVVVPCRLVLDVEDLLRGRKRRAYEKERAAQPNATDDDEEETDDEEEDFEPSEEEVEREGSRLVRVVIVDAAKASLNLGCLPVLLSHVVQHFDLCLGDHNDEPTKHEDRASSSANPEASATFLWSLKRRRNSIQELLQATIDLATAESKKQQRTEKASSSNNNVQQKTSLRHLLSAVGIPRTISEKELDLSSASRCNELLDVLNIVWKKWLARPSSSSSSTATSSSFQQPLRFLSLRRSALSTAEHLVALLKKSNLHEDLVGLDMSGNKLDSLRFLFQLRADFKERLLFLWLQENPITRKPEYREQVRATLPRLVCLDGESIRRAPLQLPHPRAPSLARNIDPQEYAEVLAVVDRFLYAWESQQVPLPPIAFKPSDRKLPFHPALTEEARQLRKRLRNGISELEQSTNEEDALFTRASSFAINAKPKKKKSANVDSNEDDSDDDDGHDGDLEEDLDENVFAKRYMHPECTFSLSTAPGCGWFDADSTSCVTELDTQLVEVARTRGVNDANNSNNGTTSSSSSKKKLLVLSKQDMNELRVMDVSIRNHHRNLILGKPALYLMVKGPVNCFTAYRSTLYPERMIVDHHLDACVPQVTLVGDEDMSGLAAKEKEAMGDREPVKGPAPSKKKIARDPYAARELPAALRARAAKAAAEGPAPAPALQISQLFLGSATLSSSTPARKPLAFLVTIHGKMSWRSPTMSADHSITLCYDRTIGLVHRPVPTKGSLPSKSLHKVPRFVVASDMIFLRPAADVASSRSHNNDVLFEARAEDRLDGVAVEFGLDGTSDNKAFARSVAERATSDAALHHVLTALLDVKTKQTNKDDDNGEGQIGLSNEELVIQQKKSEFCGELQQKELKRSESSRQLDGTNDPVLMQTRAASTTSNFLPIRTAFTVRPSFSAFDIIEFADATATDEASRKNNESGDDDLLSADKEIKIELAQVDAALAEANAFHTTSFKW